MKINPKLQNLLGRTDSKIWKKCRIELFWNSFYETPKFTTI